MAEKNKGADATQEDDKAENTDATPTPEDGPQDVPQVPISEDEVEV